MGLSPYAVLAPVSQRYPPPQDTFLRVTHPSATRAEAPVRLACVKHSASVRSEPGSNSQVHTPASLPAYKTQCLPNPNTKPNAHQPSPLTARITNQRIIQNALPKPDATVNEQACRSNFDKKPPRNHRASPFGEPERLVGDLNRFFSGAAILASPPCLVKPRRRLGEQLLRLGW